MTGAKSELADQYAQALGDHLEGAGEAALSQAYDLGRQAFGGGIGVLDLAAAHHEALASVLGLSAEQAARQAAAADFFGECLSPFEMSLRGYRSVLADVRRLNAELEGRVLELEGANAELESFAHSVSHDLSAPVRAVIGFSEMVLEGHAQGLDAEGQRLLVRVGAVATRMGQIIDDLLELSRLARRELRRTKVDLSALVGLCAAELQAVQPDRRVTLEIATGLSADADEGLVRIALENLLGNAWKFTSRRAETRVTFGVERQEGGDAYFVRDNGAGFDMTYADRMFEPFRRLHSEKQFPGSGIGLATVARIIRRHGGRIWAEGVVDGGATFYFTL